MFMYVYIFNIYIVYNIMINKKLQYNSDIHQKLVTHV